MITSWREIIHAAATVGKPLELPHAFDGKFAISEIMIRLHSLCSTLDKGADDDGIPVLTPSAWTISSADPSERRAASYRLGMALAHWFWAYHLAYFGTHHLDVKFKDHRQIKGKANQKSADLYGWVPGPPRVPWLIEAKASMLASSVQLSTREHAWKQLRGAEKRGWHQAHGQMLVSATAKPVLHLVVDVALPCGDPVSPLVIPANRAQRRRPSVASATRIVVDYIVERFLFETALDYPNVVRRGRVRNVGDSRMLDFPHLDLAIGLREPGWHDVLNLSELYQEMKSSYYSGTGAARSRGRSLQDFVHGHVTARLTQESDEMITFLEALTDYDIEMGLTEDEAYTFVISDPAGVVVMLGPSWAGSVDG
ncbi:hypothetical protein AB0C07_30190 [Actinoplanes missouriensis]|uniref:hypothetical protein n=1 Tax=Actinoplanes missouriensis TaxID=1866 RepID=UPI00340CBD1A